MSEPRRPLRPGRGSRPSPASLGVVRVDADFQDEYPASDPTCTEAYASLCRTGEALLGELDRCIGATFGVTQAAATALAVIDGAGELLTPSQVSDRVLVASATLTGPLLPGIRTIERSILSALTPGERAHLLEMLARVFARAAEVAAEQPEPLNGQRIRPARLDRHGQAPDPVGPAQITSTQ